MPYNTTVLDLDITGVNPANKIVDEPHTLTSNRPVKAITPNLGPFYGNSIVVKDIDNNILTRGADYQLVELHQEATLKYGKEIFSVILIINPSISNQVKITYQALGGHYTYSDTAILNLYNTVMNDNRPVHWSNVLNKPDAYPPSIHRHLIEDVYGFEAVVDYLERIKRAITLGQTSVVLSIIDSLISNFKCGNLIKAKPQPNLVKFDTLLYFLSKKKILSNIAVDVKDCVWVKGGSYIVQIDTRNYPIGRTLYWELYKGDNQAISLFSIQSGSFTTNGDIIEISLYITALPNIIDYPLYLGIKDSPTSDEYMAVTYLINIEEYTTTNYWYPYYLFNVVREELTTVELFDYCSSDEKRLYYLSCYY